MSTAGLRFDYRIAKAVVHVVDQEPSAAVGHAELAAGLRDRPGLRDRLKQTNLFGAEGATAAKIHCHRQS
jgi:hypothetical protein